VIVGANIEIIRELPRSLGRNDLRMESSLVRHPERRIVHSSYAYRGIWQLQVKQLAHNHPPSLNASAHPTLRKRDLEKHQAEITRSYNAGESTRTIISALRAKGAKCLPRNIYNFGLKIRLESLGGLTPIQWLKEELDRQGYYNKIDVDSTTNKVTRLFYIHPTAIQVWKKNSDCVLLDCTYKTNRFNMPLLNICGVTGNNKTPQFALCFLSGEKEEDYTWALTQLRSCMALYGIQEPKCMITDRELALITVIDELFPQSDHLLCRWHVNMNVVKNCKKHFTTKKQWDEFYAVWQIAEMLRITRRTCEYYRGKPHLPVEYLERTWLIWKEKLVSEVLRQRVL
jgi:hypothetical protein